MKVLVEIHHGIGDAVKMLPLFDGIRQAYPDAVIEALIKNEDINKLLIDFGIINQGYILNLNNQRKIDIIKLLIRLAMRRYDIGFVAPMSNYKLGKALMRFIGCKKYYQLHNVNPIETSDSDLCFVLLEDAGISVVSKYPRLHITNKVINNSKTVGLMVGSGMIVKKRKEGDLISDAKCLPLDMIEQIANELIKKGFDVILFGGFEEKRKISNSHIAFDSHIENQIAKLTLSDTISYLTKCSCVIGGDTGLIHLADALDIPTVVYYTVTNPQYVGPKSDISVHITSNADCQYCAGTDKVFLCMDRKCISNISVNDIVSSTEKILKQRENG